MNNFEINTNFNPNFNNSINDFNKIFSNSLKETSKNLNSNMSFDEVFNAIGENPDSIKAGAEITIDENKPKNISPTVKLAQEIGKRVFNGLNEINDIQKQSEEDIETFASGGDISIHQVMISAQKSQIAMNMAIQLRNQMLTAYNEFKGMSV